MFVYQRVWHYDHPTLAYNRPFHRVTNLVKPNSKNMGNDQKLSFGGDCNVIIQYVNPCQPSNCKNTDCLLFSLYEDWHQLFRSNPESFQAPWLSLHFAEKFAHHLLRICAQWPGSKSGVPIVAGKRLCVPTYQPGDIRIYILYSDSKIYRTGMNSSLTSKLLAPPEPLNRSLPNPVLQKLRRHQPVPPWSSCHHDHIQEILSRRNNGNSIRSIRTTCPHTIQRPSQQAALHNFLRWKKTPSHCQWSGNGGT